MATERPGCYSPFLTSEQKAALRLLEAGLAQGDETQVEQGMRDFLALSFQLTWDALEVTEIQATPAGLERLRQGDSGCEFAAGLRGVLWEGDALAPFARALLAWREQGGAQVDAQPDALTLEQLNDHLVASLPFYETWRPAGTSEDSEVLTPSLNLVRPIPAPTELQFSEVVDGLVERRDDHAPEIVELSPTPMESFLEPLAGPASQGEGLQLMLGAPDPLETNPVVESKLELEPETETSEPAKPPVETTAAPEGAAENRSQLGPVGPSSEGDRSQLGPVAPTSEATFSPPVLDDGTEILDVSSAPLSPLERKTGLIIKKKYLGYGKNTDGVMGYCGQLTLSRYDEGPLEGRLESSNPLLFLTNTVLSGKTALIAYWMPPAAFPQPGGHLTVRTPGQNKVLSVVSLFPQSRTDFLSGAQVLLMLLAPSLLGLLYFCFVYVLSVSEILAQVKEIFPEAYAAASAGSSALSFRSQGVGLYQLEVVPASESLQLIWAALIWFCPLLSAKFFRHLSRSRQRDLGAVLGAALLLPTLGLFGLWHAQKIVFPLLDHADFSPLDLRSFWHWGMPLNLALALYLFLSVHGVWDRRLSSGLRFLLPVMLSLLYLGAGFLIIFGRSWLG